MPMTTAHYGWAVPDIGGSTDVWGNILNDTLGNLGGGTGAPPSIDTVVWSLSTSLSSIYAGPTAPTPTNDAILTLNKAGSGYESAIQGETNGVMRWALVLGDRGAESTGNVGSDFYIYRYNDAGAINGYPLSITRSTGRVQIGYTLGVTGSAYFASAYFGNATDFVLYNDGTNRVVNWSGANGTNADYFGGGLRRWNINHAQVMTLDNAGNLATIGTVTANALSISTNAGIVGNLGVVGSASLSGGATVAGGNLVIDGAHNLVFNPASSSSTGRINFPDFHGGSVRFGVESTDSSLHVDASGSDYRVVTSRGANTGYDLHFDPVTPQMRFQYAVSGSPDAVVWNASYGAGLFQNATPAGDALSLLNQIAVSAADFVVPEQFSQHRPFCLTPIAVQEIAPNAYVAGTNGCNAMVNDQAVIAMLVRAVQQLTARVVELEARAT